MAIKETSVGIHPSLHRWSCKFDVASPCNLTLSSLKAVRFSGGMWAIIVAQAGRNPSSVIVVAPSKERGTDTLLILTRRREASAVTHSCDSTRFSNVTNRNPHRWIKTTFVCPRRGCFRILRGLAVGFKVVRTISSPLYVLILSFMRNKGRVAKIR